MKISDRGGVTHQPLPVSENWSDCPFVWYQNICSALFVFVTDRENARWAEIRIRYQSAISRLSMARTAASIILCIGHLEAC